MTFNTSASKRYRSIIRPSTNEDAIAIHSWLLQEEANGVQGNFLCNWNLTEECHKEGSLLVFVDGPSQEPVAYQWGGLIKSGILQVRSDMRGRGIGRKLVDRCIADAIKRDEFLLYIQCKPSTSIPFWSAMGFTLVPDSNRNNCAYRALERKHDLTACVQTAEVVIRFFDENRRWDKTVAPISIARPTAAISQQGVVQLGETVTFFDGNLSGTQAIVVEIEIDGKQRFLEKPKCEEATRLGVHHCTNGFYIDFLHPI